MNSNLILALYGASGTGKSWSKRWFVDHGWSNIKSYTTRPTREGETNEYYFVSRNEFKALMIKGLFINVNEYQGHYYGIAVEDLACPGPSVLITDITSIVRLKVEAAEHDRVVIVARVIADLSTLKKRHIKRRTYARIGVAYRETRALDDAEFQPDFILNEDIESHQRLHQLYAS